MFKFLKFNLTTNCKIVSNWIQGQNVFEGDFILKGLKLNGNVIQTQTFVCDMLKMSL